MPEFVAEELPPPVNYDEVSAGLKAASGKLVMLQLRQPTTYAGEGRSPARAARLGHAVVSAALRPSDRRPAVVQAYDGAAAEDPQDDAHAAAMARATAHEDAMAQVQGEAAGGEGQEGAEPARQLSERRASSNADEEGAAAAAATFDADVHRAYLELPAWPHAEEQTLKVGCYGGRLLVLLLPTQRDTRDESS
jgi:hypothetical protein